MQSPTNTPQVIPLRIITTSSTAPLLQELTTAYSLDHTLISFITQNNNTSTLQYIIENPSSSSSLYAITNYLPRNTPLWAAPIGQDAIAIIAHPDIDIDYLTADDLRSIFMGIATNWAAFGNSDITLVVVARESTSTTRQAFQDQVMGQRAITPAARLATTRSSMLNIVAETPGAIGFISMAYLTDDVQAIPIATQEGDTPTLPSIQTVAAEAYPLRIPLLIIGTQPPVPNDGYYEFIVWLQNEGQSIIAEHYVPLAN
jgi:phosphate transport system substrate-binding protein